MGQDPESPGKRGGNRVLLAYSLRSCSDLWSRLFANGQKTTFQNAIRLETIQPNP
jgi:hypothetical protein